MQFITIHYVQFLKLLRFNFIQKQFPVHDFSVRCCQSQCQKSFIRRDVHSPNELLQLRNSLCPIRAEYINIVHKSFGYWT